MVHSCIGDSLLQKPRLRGSLCCVPQASCRHLPHPAASAHRRSSHAWPVSVVACRRGSQDIGGLLWRRIISTLNQNPPGHRSGRLLSHPRLCRRPCHVCQDLFRKREPHEATITKNPPFPRGIATDSWDLPPVVMLVAGTMPRMVSKVPLRAQALKSAPGEVGLLQGTYFFSDFPYAARFSVMLARLRRSSR